MGSSTTVIKAIIRLPELPQRAGGFKMHPELLREVRAQQSVELFDRVADRLAPKMEALISNGTLLNYGAQTGGPAGWVTDAWLFARVPDGKSASALEALKGIDELKNVRIFKGKSPL